MPNYQFRKRLPVTYSTEIGRIITTFAQIEWALQIIIVNLLGINEQQGRVAVRKARVHDAVTMIEDLLKLRSFSVSHNLVKLKKHLKQLESYRDRLAHGMWIKHPSTNTPTLWDFSGAYVTGAQNIQEKPKILPIPVKLELKQLKNISSKMRTAHKTLDEMNEIIRGLLLASHELRAQQSQMRGR